MRRDALGAGLAAVCLWGLAPVATRAAVAHLPPLPLLLPAVDLLESVGEKGAAARIYSAIEKVLTERRALTADLGGESGTVEMAEAIVAALN